MTPSSWQRRREGKISCCWIKTEGGRAPSAIVRIETDTGISLSMTEKKTPVTITETNTGSKQTFYAAFRLLSTLKIRFRASQLLCCCVSTLCSNSRRQICRCWQSVNEESNWWQLWYQFTSVGLWCYIYRHIWPVYYVTFLFFLDPFHPFTRSFIHNTFIVNVNIFFKDNLLLTLFVCGALFKCSVRSRTPWAAAW